MLEATYVVTYYSNLKMYNHVIVQVSDTLNHVL